MLNTLDLDEISKEQLFDILTKIFNKECCEKIEYKDSDSKGYHIWITCKKDNCFLCRLVFDHDKRFLIDSFQPLQLQNTFFDFKEYFIFKEVFGHGKT